MARTISYVVQAFEAGRGKQLRASECGHSLSIGRCRQQGCGKISGKQVGCCRLFRRRRCGFRGTGTTSQTSFSNPVAFLPIPSAFFQRQVSPRFNASRNRLPSASPSDFASAKNDPQHKDRWLALAHSLLSMAVVEDVNRGTLSTTMLTEVARYPRRLRLSEQGAHN